MNRSLPLVRLLERRALALRRQLAAAIAGNLPLNAVSGRSLLAFLAVLAG